MDIKINLTKQKTLTYSVAAKTNNIPPIRPRFMLDRDQIFYSSAFRRLAGKTQLIAAGQDELLRTRLTHTLEVSQIARSIGEALGLDLDLVEAIVLGHDLGHTPFGHVGERTLHELMTPDLRHPLGRNCPLCDDPAHFPKELHPFLGFKHNLQSLVVAMELEKNADGRGLNLTPYTLYGLQAHTKPLYKEGKIRNHAMLGYYQEYLEKKIGNVMVRNAWSLEALLVAQADEIAQWHHDLEDALRAGLLTPREIVGTLGLTILSQKTSLSPEEEKVLREPEKYDLENFIYVFTRVALRTLMEVLAETAARNIDARGGMYDLKVEPINCDAGAKTAHIPNDTCPPDPEIFSYGDSKQVGSFAWAVEAFSAKIGGVLGNDQIRKADAEGKQVILDLFTALYDHPEKLPEEAMYGFFGAYHAVKGNEDLKAYCRPEFQKMPETQLRDEAQEKPDQLRGLFGQVFGDRSQTTRVEELLLMRAICNHIASMTDNEARKALKKLHK